MSFEIAPNATLSAYSLPTATTSTTKSLYGVERFMHGNSSEDGVMAWCSWSSTMTSPTTGQTTWYNSPTNAIAGTQNPDNHLFGYITYAYSLKRIYTTGLGRQGNTTYPTNKISFADYSSLRTSESVFPNIAFTKCSGTFPTAIRPQGIACTNDGQRIMVIGNTNNTVSYIMGSNDSGNSWFSMPVPPSLSQIFASVGAVECDGNFFYVLTNFNLVKIGVNITSSSTANDWTQIDFSTTSAKPDYAVGYSNLRIFNLDRTDTNKLYMFSYSNINNVEGYGGGVFVSTDTVNWTLVRFSTLQPLRFTTEIYDISFANRFGNKIVVTANFNQWNNDNRRYLFYTSDLTGRTGWASVEPAGMDRTNYYDICSTAITPDNRYFVFDRLGSVYYTSDITGTFTKASTADSSGGSYGAKVHYIDGSTYARSSLGNSAYDTEEQPFITYNYAYDSYKDSDSLSSRKWTKQNLTFSGFDDQYSNEPVNIGFDWGYNGSTYNSFRLNTNGQLHFNNFTGSYSLDATGDRIVANYGDLWLDQGLINTTNPATSIITTGTVVTPAVLRSQYKISTTQVGDYVLFSLDVNAAEPCALWLNITGYNIAGGYIGIGGEGLVDFDGFKLNLGEQLSQITSFTVSYCNSYSAYIKNYFPWGSLAGLLNNNTHGVWTKNITWSDNGVQHNIFRMAVYCGRYGNNAKDHSYRVSLYKAGASQKISISALSKFSSFVYAQTSVVGKNCGPYPAANNASLKATLNYDETTWYSDDNGATWYLNNKDSTNKSTVVQMGPSIATSLGSNNVSLNKTKLYLNTNRTNLYAATDAWSTNINANTFGYPDAINVKIGPNMHLMLMRYIVGERTSNTFGETQLFTVFGTTYKTTVNKTDYYFSYGDLDRNNSISLTDAVDMERISKGLEPYGSYSTSGAQVLVEYLLNNYPNDVIDAAYTYGWITPNTTTMSSMFDNSRMLTGVKNLTASTTADIKASALRELGPVYRSNVNGKIYNPAPDWKPNYTTAQSNRNYIA